MSWQHRQQLPVSRQLDGMREPPIGCSCVLPCPLPALPPAAATCRLFRIIQNVAAHLGCHTSDPFTPPPGWQLVTTLNLSEGPAGQLPLGAIMLNPALKQLVVAIRGTRTAWEWGSVNFVYNQASVVGCHVTSGRQLAPCFSLC